MIIEKEILEKWTKIKSAHDVQKLVEKYQEVYPDSNPYRQMFDRAFKGDHCSDEVFKVMASFYKAKQKEILKVLS